LQYAHPAKLTITIRGSLFLEALSSSSGKDCADGSWTEAAKALNGLKTMPAKRLITKHVLRLSKGFGDEKLVDMTDGLKKGDNLRLYKIC
jgi:hypothetical protein